MTPTHRAFIGGVAAAALALAACGGDGSDHDAAADRMIELAEEFDIELNKDCVEELAADWSDEDATIVAESEGSSTPNVSEEGDAIGEAIFNDCAV